jgi:putative ABC transport system permease protein
VALIEVTGFFSSETSKKVTVVKKYWLGFDLAYRNITRHKRRSIIAVGAVGFGVIAFILASGFIEYIFWGLREATIESQLGHIQISRPGYQESGKADPFSFLLSDTPPELEAVTEPHQIKAIAPRLSFSGLISHEEATLSFIGDGIDPRAQSAFGDSLQIVAGQNLSPADSKAIIMGAGLAQNLGVNIDDQVVLLAKTASGGINGVEVSIRGLFSTVTKAYDDSALRIPISTARQLLRTQGTHTWIMLLNDTAQTDTVLAGLRNKFGKDFEIVPWYDLADFYNKTVVLFSKQVQGMRLIIAFIILLSISNTMTMSIIERTGEIGTSLALGVKRSIVMRLFLTEGIVLGCLGGAFGLTVGLLLASLISSIGVPMPPPPGMARGYMGEIRVTWDIALESLILAIGTTLAASLYPAWKASRMQIVDALRHNR